jgi:ferredoxin
VDEGNAAGGERARNWDSCQFSLFTQHASGHNPRASQFNRQRQRVYHKFRIYPEKFGETLCTGCGACTRNCPAGLGILGIATEISHG